jgi:hypothetical protein
LRDDARLLVVVVSDEDDCSETAPPQVAIGQDSSRDYCHEQDSLLRPVADYFQDFKDLKDASGQAREVLWTAIAPVARADKSAAEILDDGQVRNVDCPTSSGPGFRHRAMAQLFDQQLENLASICQTDYHDTLVAIAQLAAERQTLEVMNVADPRLLVVDVTRADGNVQPCSVANGGISYEAAVDGRAARVHFLASCQRKADDRKVEVKVLCAG